MKIPDNKTRRKRLIKECDTLVSKLCKERDKHICQYCGRPGVHAHHVFSRSFHALRWDLENLITLCAGCHRFKAHGQGIHEFIDFIKGRVNYDSLKLRSHNQLKTSVPNMEIVKHKLKEQDEN